MARKITALALALLLMLGMGACGGADLSARAVPEPTPEPFEDPEGEPAAEETPAPQTFVLNTNTKKYHDPSCPSVDEMSEKNKSVYEGTREELESRGYVACKRCGGGA